MKQSGIYKITINDKSYVGLSADIVRRTKTHRNSFQNNTHGNRHLQRAYNKYKDFQLEILEKCEDWIEEKETMWIEKLDTYKSGFNQDEGGGGGASPSPESRKKMSVAKTGVPIHTEESRKKLSISHTGDLNHNYHHKATADDIGFDKYENKMSEKQLMEKYECSRTTIIRRIRKWHKDNGTTYRRQQNDFPQMRKDINTNDVKSDRKNGMTFAELMKKYKCEADTIMRRLKR